MSLKKVIVSTAAAAALATSAFSAVELDKTGDYLLFPAYFAQGDWKTDLRVVNTNTTASVIAKVVIRDGHQSDEKVDFIIYLTPGDVWEGVIYEDGGNFFVNSTDDSMVLGNVLASEVAGGHTLTFPAAVNGQVLESGYVEVFAVEATADTATVNDDLDPTYPTYTAVDFGAAPVDKHALYTAFAKDHDDVVWMNATGADITGQSVVYSDGATGQLAMTSPATAMYLTVNGAEAIADGAVAGGITERAYVLANILGVDTKLATMIDFDGTPYTDVCDVIGAIETNLNKTSSYVIHYGDGATLDETALLANFVTKKYRLDEGLAACRIYDIFPYEGAQEFATPQSADYYVTYTNVPRDMEEHTPSQPEPGEISGITTDDPIPETCDDELCYISVANEMGAEGYVTYSFFGDDDNETTAPANDVSPMPYDHRVMTAKNVGGVNVTNIINPAYK